MQTIFSSKIIIMKFKSLKLIPACIIAMAIAIPVSWWAIDDWLKSFAYRVNVSWIIFLVACSVALSIALLTVSYESIKAAVANPIKSLRTE